MERRFGKMLDQFLGPMTLLVALGAGLVAGVFFAFSTFVMRALARLPAVEGIAAMQAINIAVINPIFLGVFLGTAALCAVVCVAAVMQWERSGAAWALAGGVLYLVGSFLVTMICNVPLNNSLAVVLPTDHNAAAVWSSYLVRWTLWNHARTVASLGSATALIVSMMRH